MATPTPRAALKALFAKVLGLPTAYVVWKGDKEPSPVRPAPQFTWAMLRVGVSSRNAVGWDDLRKADNGGGSLSITQVGRRVLVLSLDLFSYASADVVLADDLMEILRSRIQSPDNLQALNAMGLVQETSGPITPLPTSVNGSEISAAHLDMTVALAWQDTATNPGGNSWVSEVLGTGTVTTESGGTATATFDVKDTGGMPPP